MVKRLLLMLVGVALGVLLAWFAILFLKRWVLPISCGLVTLILVAWLIWIYRGGLKKKKG